MSPILADGVFVLGAPKSTDLPAENLVTGDLGKSTGSMSSVCIPRHGQRPQPVPTKHTQAEPLPGAVNIEFYDGHGELAQRDRLWSLYWHRDY